MAEENAGWSSLRALRNSGVKHALRRVNNYQMKIDLQDNVISTHLYLSGRWEPFETDLIAKCVQPGMAVVDIGAHIGYYSLLVATVLQSRGRVLAFEPSWDNFALLAENIQLNGFSGIIQAEQAALSHKNGEVDLYLSSYNSGDHRTYPTAPDDDAIFNAGAARQLTRVRAYALDEYLRERGISQVDIIKIDVQGAEMGVFWGMRSTLLRNPQLLLFMEYWPHGLRRCRTDPLALLRFLTDEIGLSLWHILAEEERLTPVEPASFAAQLPAEDPQYHTNLIGCRSPATILANISHLLADR